MDCLGMDLEYGARYEYRNKLTCVDIISFSCCKFGLYGKNKRKKGKNVLNCLWNKNEL